MIRFFEFEPISGYTYFMGMSDLLNQFPVRMTIRVEGSEVEVRYTQWLKWVGLRFS